MRAWERGYGKCYPRDLHFRIRIQYLRLCGEVEVAESQPCKSFLFGCSSSYDARMPLPGAENEGSKKPKFEKDFIVLSEFSEQVGPIPIVSNNAKKKIGRRGGGYGLYL